MTAQDMVLVIGAVGAVILNLAGLILQFMTAARMKRVEVHTNGMLATMVKSAKEQGAQEEKAKQ